MILVDEAINQEIVLVTNAPKQRAVTLHRSDKSGMDGKQHKSVELKNKKNTGRTIIFEDIPKVSHMNEEPHERVVNI